MKSLFRFLGVLRTLIRYRLDHLILSTSFLKSLSPLIYLTPWHYFPSKKLTRGERIRLALEELGPIFIKFGQTLSTRRDLLPDDIGMELAKLQDKCPPFPAEESKQIIEKALGNKKDVLIVISTSGNSANIIEALKEAKRKNILSIALLGGKGGKAKNLANLDLIIPSNETARIQECHIFLGHIIFENVEKKIFKN